MAMSINPVVSGGRRRCLGQGIAFTGGAFIGAVATFVAAAFVVAAARELQLREVVLAAIGLGVLRDLGVPVPMPYRRVQVPYWFREMLPPAAFAATYGFMLGLGFATLYTYSVHLTMVVAVALFASPTQMLVCALVFAVGKSITLLTAAGARNADESASAFRWRPTRMSLLKLGAATASVAVAAAGLAGPPFM